MIVGFSTSSPWSSVALLDSTGRVLVSLGELAPGRASGTCLSLLQACLERTGRKFEEATLFAADLGPGSFTGTRVGIMLAKTLAWQRGVMCIGASSFNLISTTETVVLPSKKGEWFVKAPGTEPVRISEIPAEATGYGFGGIDTPPDPGAFGKLLPALTPVSPERLVPKYLIEPSISQSKQPLSRIHLGSPARLEP